MLKRFGSKECVRYDPPPSKHIFDYNYQKAGILNVIELLKGNTKASAKLKDELLKKAQETLGLPVLPTADRVLPFFHLHDGDISVTFVYNDPPFTPWQVLIANNFGDLVPLYKQAYDLIRTPSVSSTGPTIGSVNIFHNKQSNAHALTNGSVSRLKQLENPVDEDLVVVFEEPEPQNMQVAIPAGKNTSKKIKNQNNHSSMIQSSDKEHSRSHSPNSNKRAARMITKKITVSTSMPDLDEFDHSNSSHHRYSTRNKVQKNNSSFVHNQSAM